jgi:glycosyltransferase involved in cell wall biosynthesis
MQETRKVIQVVRRFSLNNWGSSENTAWETSKSLTRQGVSNVLFATSALESHGQEFINHTQVSRFKYFYPQLWLSKAHINRLDLKAGNPYSLSMCKALIETPCRLFHCHTNARLAASVRLVAKFRKLPYIVSLHNGELIMPNSESNLLSKRQGSIARFGRLIDIFTKPKRVLTDASGIICLSYDDFLAIKKSFPLKPCLYLPSGVDFEQFNRPANCDFKKVHNIDKAKTLLLCPGRIDTQKNQLLLVDMLYDLARYHNGSFHLILAGHISNQSYFQSLLERINKLGLKNKVTITEGLQHDSEELKAAYQQSDACILPSIHDPMGIAVIEAWAAKIPVLAAKVGGLSTLIDDRETGLFFNPYSKASLSTALNTLLNNKALRERLITHGFMKAKTSYLWEQHSEKLLNFYDEVEMCHQSQHPSQLIC